MPEVRAYVFGDRSIEGRRASAGSDASSRRCSTTGQPCLLYTSQERMEKDYP